MSARTPVRCALAALAVHAITACDSHPLDATTVVPTTLTDGLLAHYTFDEGVGTTVVDHSGNRHDGTLTGGRWIPDGEFGGALHLGGSDYVTVDNFPNARSSLSVSAWVRSTDMPVDGFETLLSTELVFEAGWELNLEKLDSGQTIQSAYWDPLIKGYTHFDCPCMPSGRWVHLVSILDGVAHTLSVFVDDQLVGVVSAPDPISPGEPSLLIGTWSGAQRFLVGDIDDIAIYSRALVPEEVTGLGAHPPPDPL